MLNLLQILQLVFKKKRKASGLTQKELADKLGISQVMISRWENGEENFTVTTLAKISTALNTPLSNPLSA